MTKCLNQGCENEVTSVAGRRPRQFCSNNCRQKDWQRKQKEKLLESYVETGEVITRTIQTSTEVFKPKAAPKPEKLPDVPKIEEKAAMPPKIEPDKHVVKRSYNQWLNLAKEIELEDERDEFMRELEADSSLNARQREMILSKLKK